MGLDGKRFFEMDALLKAGREEPDPEQRKKIYGRINDMIIDRALTITLFYEVNACAFNRGLAGVVPRALTGLYFFNDWSWK